MLEKQSVNSYLFLGFASFVMLASYLSIKPIDSIVGRFHFQNRDCTNFKWTYDLYNVEIDYEYRYPLIEGDNKLVYPIPKTTEDIQWNIDKLEPIQNVLSIKGWAFHKKKPDRFSQLFMILSGKQEFAYYTKTIQREDVANSYDTQSLANCGFSNIIELSDLPKDLYRVGLLINSNGVKSYISTNRLINLIGPINFIIPSNDVELKFNIDRFEEKTSHFLIHGWSFLNPSQKCGSTYISFINDSHTITFPTMKNIREDIGTYFDQESLNEAGFITEINKNQIPSGKYKIKIHTISNDSIGGSAYLPTEAIL